MLQFAVDQQIFTAAIGQIMRKRIVGIEILAFLVERRDFQIGAELHRAAIGLQLAREHLQKRGFTGTVRTHETDAISTMDAQRKRRDDHALAISLGDGLGLDDQLAGFTSFGNGRLHRALRPLMAAIFRTHGLKLADAAHVALAPCGHAIAHPVFFTLDGLAELVLFQFFLFQHLVAPFLEMGKTAIETARLATIQPDGRG